MAFRVRLATSAREDAREILAWLLSQGAGETGLRWFRGLYTAISSLSEMPARCALAPENEDFPFSVRQLLYGSGHHRYRILFTVEDDVVSVLHIRHGRRTPLTH